MNLLFVLTIPLIFISWALLWPFWMALLLDNMLVTEFED